MLKVFEKDIKEKGDSPIEFIKEGPVKIESKVEVKNEEDNEDSDLVRNLRHLITIG